MAARERSGKTASNRSRTRSGSSSTRTSSGSRRKTTRKQQQPAPPVAMRPEHQRELFALALITIALVTLVFFTTGVTGGIGAVYLQFMQKIFGSGALIVPLALGMLGITILIQEQLYDTRFAGSHVAGTAMVLVTLLALLEFPKHEIALAERPGEGGGIIGFEMVEFLDTTIGRPAAMVVVIMVMVAGLLLTFNTTLRELVPGMVAWLRDLWETAWSGPRRPREPASQHELARRLSDLPPLDNLRAPDAASPDPASGDIVATPIAERPTRASLFRRSELQGGESEETPQPVPDKRKQGKEQEKEAVPPPPAPLPAASKPAGSQASSADDKEEHEKLEGLNEPMIHLAWPLPSIELLDKPREGAITENERQTRARLIEETLSSFKVEAQVIGVHTGPVITQFELQPAVGVKISKITALEKDLALALAAPSIRIEAPIPGKSAVGIEIPNIAISLVTLREVIDCEEFERHKGTFKLPLGKDVSGTPMMADLTRMPHLLVAGSTGSGKSVAINSFLCGLLLRHTPEELRIILVDPKMVELTVYNHVPHLLSPVVTEMERVVPTLKWATREMERRYKVFARLGCRNLESYQKRTRTKPDLEPMPTILIVIDELADLMMMAPDDVETQICRLAQMARATGIHLIIATQRPSVDVITGLIKANFPSRIAFAVTSQVDSRVILDTPGAERLLGRGDMLYMGADSAKLLRMQGTYVSDTEVERIVAFWRKATPPGVGSTGGGKAESRSSGNQSEESEKDGSEGDAGEQRAESCAAQPGNAAAEGSTAYTPPGGFLSAEEQEELLPQAVDLVRQHRRASASMLQRRLRIGYSKAAQLIDLLEEQGVIGPPEEGRSREVLQQG